MFGRVHRLPPPSAWALGTKHDDGGVETGGVTATIEDSLRGLGNGWAGGVARFEDSLRGEMPAAVEGVG